MKRRDVTIELRRPLAPTTYNTLAQCPRLPPLAGPMFGGDVVEVIGDCT